ncbi:MAG: hypothetical protein CL785_04765 [Chloroflexi bacterium]|nr:hypothetical protein [Chloroflexota bacterium]|tara:strand:+ start:3087 stop:4010 length:924 start_codon:yes stop_codon:yes gene_type:complete
MSNNQLSSSEQEALNNCIDLIRNGSDLEDSLALYPDIKEKIKPFLLNAIDFQNSSNSIIPKNEFQQSLRKTLSNEFILNTSKSKFSFKFSWGLQKTTAVIAIAFISIISSGLLVTSASASSLPGETLYPAKKLKEGIMLRIIPSDAQKVKFHTNLIQQRTQEMELIISKKKPASDLNRATQNMNSHIEKTFTIILANKVKAGLISKNQAIAYNNSYKSRTERNQCISMRLNQDHAYSKTMNPKKINIENSHVYLKNILLSEIERQKNMPGKYNNYLSKTDQAYVDETFHCSMIKLLTTISILDQLVK